MRLALGLAVLGIVLGVIATFGYLGRTSDAGDPMAAEQRLDPPPTQAPPTIDRTSTSTTDARPVWFPNEMSSLTDLQASTRPIPTRLRIETLDIDAPIGAYGVDGTGQMDVPDNVTDAGWYKHGPTPGEPGSAVVAAHVDLAGPGEGLFYDLQQLDVDDEIGVGFADGSTRWFRVIARSTYPKSELPLNRIFSRQGDPILTLVTCGGGFSQSTRSYDSNVVVYAEPIMSTRGFETAPPAQRPAD